MTKEDKKYRIYIDNRGNWYQDGIKITHKWTYLANNRNLDIDENGEYFVDEGTGRVYVKVEDTPFVVTMVDRKDDGFHMYLNDSTSEPLSIDKLYLNEDNIPYTRVKNGRFTARFLRPAYYELAKYAVEEDDGFYLESDGKKFRIMDKKQKEN